MAAECCDLIETIQHVQEGLLDSQMIALLEDAKKPLVGRFGISEFLLELEKLIHPENEISSQLRPLFLEARDVLSEIHPHIKDQGRSRETFQRISHVLKIIAVGNIAERIKASKPSRSSSQITMEMVGFIGALLYCTEITLYRVAIWRDARVGLQRGAQAGMQLQKKLRSLRVFILTAKRCIEHESMKDFFTLAEDVAYLAARLCFLWLANEDHAPPLNDEFSKLLERISPFRPELRQIYLNVLTGSKSSRSEASMKGTDMLDVVSALQEDLKEMLTHGASMKIDFDALILCLQKGLVYLSEFLGDIESEGISLGELGSLPSHIESLAIEAAIAIYSSYDEEMDKTTDVDNALFLLQLKFNHVMIEGDLIQLLISGSGIIAPMKDLLYYVWGELIFLGTFLMNLSEQCKEHDRITDILTLIQSVTSHARSFIDSLSQDLRQQHGAWKISCLNFQLLLKFKFVKAVIRWMCPVSSASLTPDHPMIDLMNFFPVNFEVIDSYFSMLKSSKTSSSGRLKMDEVLMGFHEFVFDNLLLKDEINSTFSVADKVKKFYYGLLLLVTYLIDPPVQHIECKKHNNLVTRFGTIAIEAESALFLSYEDVVDSNKCRKVNLILQFLTVAVKFTESEGSLIDLLKHKATLKAQILDLIESSHEELIFLRAILMDFLRQYTQLEKLHDLLMHAQKTAYKLAQIGGSFYESFMDGSSSENMPFSDYLQGIESIKVEVRKVCFQLLDASSCNMINGESLIDFLLNQQEWLLNYDVCSISFLTNQIPVVRTKLVCLGSLLADIVQYRHIQQEINELWKHVQDIKYVCFFNVRSYRPAWYYMLYLSDVKELLRFVEAEVKMICGKNPDSSSYIFPKTNGLGFLNCFLRKLEELSRYKLHSIIDLKHQIESVKESFLCLKSFFDYLEESYDEHDEFYSLITSVTEMAYKAEYVTDSCLACSHPLWYKVLWISEVVEDIKLLNKVVSDALERKKIDVTVRSIVKTSMNLVPSISVNSPRENEEMEGFQDAMEELKNQLLEGSPELDLISIVGMPGLGKTTLAKKIYNDTTVMSHFDVRAECRVTQVYSWREVLLTILNGVLEPADRSEKEDGELADELRRFLLTKRFLILIDDVWDDKVWDNLYMCIKDAQNGSRIILTTRLSDIANYAKCESEPHHLRLFRDDESWTLLQKEVFQGQSCPPDLVDVGSRIAKRCRGLPLSIVLVAGVLKQKKHKADSWEVVEESLGSKSIGSLEESMAIIGFSYKNLPLHLKPCFLYFGGFLKGKNISVSKLTRLWLAEQFVRANGGKGLEDAAQDFLKDLIRRNLVMSTEKRPNGKVKECSIHDLLHTFCLEKAKQENFLLQVNSGEDVFPEKPKEYRLFVHTYQDEIDSWRPSRSNIRSLLFNSIDPDSFSWPRDISFIFDSFKLVKVLDLESFNIGGTFPSEIQSLVHLRYFAAQTDANSIPSSIAKLWNLETFVVRGLGGEMILPSSLLKMVKLRHIHVDHRASFGNEHTDESLANSQLANLETFSTPHLAYGEDAENILRKMPNLKKLGCVFSGTFGSSSKMTGRCVLFPRLEFLSHLESLKLVSNSYPAKLPHDFNFPLQLTELTLSKFRLPWNQISTIAELPNLEILKLCLRAFEGDPWEVKDSEFPKLKYLKLDNLKIAQWVVCDDASFPKLEHLVLTKCKQLEKIPSYFEEAVSLRIIEVNWCSWSVANSAQEIQTMQREDYANDAFTVTIQPPDWARRSSS